MDDKQILDLYWERSEAAISETSKKYGKYCRYIASNILHNDEDSEECVNDTYLRAWNSIPPLRFFALSSSYLSKDKLRVIFPKKLLEKEGISV
jgi:DNA-directed RNA polymerase specialized sigma24 family protein